MPLLGRIQSDPGVDNITRPLWPALKVPGQMHSLRHRFCSWEQIDLAVPLPIVSQWMGHARVSTTAIYMHGRVEPRRPALSSRQGKSHYRRKRSYH